MARGEDALPLMHPLCLSLHSVPKPEASEPEGCPMKGTLRQLNSDEIGRTKPDPINWICIDAGTVSKNLCYAEIRSVICDINPATGILSELRSASVSGPLPALISRFD